MQPAELTAALKREAARLGFNLAGACPAVTPPGFGRFQDWLAAGYVGEMHYLGERAEASRHPSGVLDGARSLLMLSMDYRTAEPSAPRPGEGRISRYAWGSDYHDLIRDRLNQLADYLIKLTGSNERLSKKFRDVPVYPWNFSTSYAPRCDAGPPSFISFKSSRSEKRPAGRPNEQG